MDGKNGNTFSKSIVSFVHRELTEIKKLREWDQFQFISPGFFQSFPILDERKN